MPNQRIRFSSEPGKIPTVDELSGYKFGWNTHDGIYYGLKLVDGVYEVVVIGGSGPAGEGIYLYIAYASDDIGTNFTLDPESKLPYQAILKSIVEIEFPEKNDFDGLWRSQLQSDWNQTVNTAPDFIKNKPSLAKAFTDLTDVIPEDYIGKAKHVPIVVDQEDKLDLFPTVLLPTVLAKFILLADCPASYAGHAGKGIRVNATEDGLEFFKL